MVRAALNARTGLLALITTGCLGVELVAPGKREPFVYVRANVSHSDTLMVGMEVLLTTAVNAAGRSYELPDPTIYVNGAAVRPVSPPANGGYTYQMTLHPSAPGDTAEFVRVFIPALDAGAAAPTPIVIPFVGRRGDTTLPLSAGDDLVLAIAAPKGVPTAHAEWWLQLKASCSSGPIFVILQSPGSPPDPLTVPWSILQQVAPPAFDACLQYWWSTTSADAGYRTQLVVQAQVRWRVEIRR